MNSDVFLKRLKEVTKNMIETNWQISERNIWRSDYGYEDDLEHDYGYESSYHNLPYSIFQIQYIFQPDLLHISCWDEQFWRIIILLVDYYTLPCQN